MDFPPIIGSAPIQANRFDSKTFHSSDDSVTGGFEERQSCMPIGDDVHAGEGRAKWGHVCQRALPHPAKRRLGRCKLGRSTFNEVLR